MNLGQKLLNSDSYQKRPTRIQWAIDEDEKQGLYDDLGIIGEISSPERQCKKQELCETFGYRDNVCKVIDNCRSMKFETPSSSGCNEDIWRKRKLTRLKRKRIRQNTSFGVSASGAKQVRMDANNNLLNKSLRGSCKGMNGLC